ncbi:MAG: pseudouridine synthase [Gammaproteobacteria bacterium]|nr:pseudouridine synthase [Gammaproteobacteria bacterium]
MARLVMFNKPFGVLSQFTPHASHPCLAEYIDQPGVYPAGRLDRDSEGLLLLTDNGKFQQRLSNPRYNKKKRYLVQVEREISDEALERLCLGVELNDGRTRPATATRVEAPNLWPRVPPIRVRQTVPTSWLSLTLQEGRNRQIRRMTAAVGYPTLRLVRVQIANWRLEGLQPGKWVLTTIPD